METYAKAAELKRRLSQAQSERQIRDLRLALNVKNEEGKTLREDLSNTKSAAEHFRHALTAKVEEEKVLRAFLTAKEEEAKCLRQVTVLMKCGTPVQITKKQN